jgi:hypothetical protein
MNMRTSLRPLALRLSRKNFQVSFDSFRYTPNPTTSRWPLLFMPYAIMNALDRQIPTWKDPKYIPYPSTWLNGERWNDEIKPTKQAFSIPFPEIYEGGNTDDPF